MDQRMTEQVFGEEGALPLGYLKGATAAQNWVLTTFAELHRCKAAKHAYEKLEKLKEEIWGRSSELCDGEAIRKGVEYDLEDLKGKFVFPLRGMGNVVREKLEEEEGWDLAYVMATMDAKLEELERELSDLQDDYLVIRKPIESNGKKVNPRPEEEG